MECGWSPALLILLFANILYGSTKNLCVCSNHWWVSLHRLAVVFIAVKGWSKASSPPWLHHIPRESESNRLVAGSTTETLRLGMPVKPYFGPVLQLCSFGFCTKSGIQASSKSDLEITPKFDPIDCVLSYYKSGSRSAFIFVQFERHCKMAWIPITHGHKRGRGAPLFSRDPPSCHCTKS